MYSFPTLSDMQKISLVYSYFNKFCTKYFEHVLGQPVTQYKDTLP